MISLLYSISFFASCWSPQRYRMIGIKVMRPACYYEWYADRTGRTRYEDLSATDDRYRSILPYGVKENRIWDTAGETP